MSYLCTVPSTLDANTSDSILFDATILVILSLIKKETIGFKFITNLNIKNLLLTTNCYINLY